MRTFFKKHKYKLNGLLLILPVYFFYQSLNPVFPAAWQAQKVGEFEFTPMPFDDNPPYSHHGHFVKDFLLMVNSGDIRHIRQAYINIGPEALQLNEMQWDEEGVLHGSQHGQHAHAIAPENIAAGDKLWLTIQDWQMKTTTVSWPIPDSFVSH